MTTELGNLLEFPDEDRRFLEPYLPQHAPPFQSPPPPPTSSSPAMTSHLPHVTLTYATSLDGHLTAQPDTRTLLSGPRSKAMTHYLRSRHDAILVGAGTAVADDPKLNCRLSNVPMLAQSPLAPPVQPQPQPQPRLHPLPIVLDPQARWNINAESAVVRAAAAGAGRGVWVILGEGVEYDEVRRKAVEGCGGRLIRVGVDARGRVPWKELLKVLAREGGVRSVMVEGGARVARDLLGPEERGIVSSVVVTVAPLWLGRGGLAVDANVQTRLKHVRWNTLGDDGVLCGTLDTREESGLEVLST